MTTKTTKAPDAEKGWEIKDRTYVLTGNRSPISWTIQTKHTARKPLLYFDEATGINREIRYATNQRSLFVDGQDGAVTLSHVMFLDGVLYVPKEEQNLQKLLSLYHPGLNVKYAEFDAVITANNDLEDLDIQIDALVAAREIDIDQAEAILRVEIGSAVSGMSSKEIRRDLLLFARRNPGLFIELANDENVQLRNFAIKASEAGIIKLSQDQRTFMWGTNNAKLMTVPFDENPYSAMAAFFKTDEGVEIFKSIEKKFK